MNKLYKTAIVGGGASGLMTAVELLSGDNALLGSEVIIIEKTDRVGKKLASTGNGQGNLTNENISCEFYRGDKYFIDEFIELAHKTDIKEYLYSLGIPLCTLKDGKMYPLSRQASAVVDVLRAYLDSKGCVTVTGECVKQIFKQENFVLKTENNCFYAQTVVLAFGGSVAKQFGTDGTSYNLAKDFGHKITKLYPSLVQLKTQTDLIKGLKGLKEIAKVTAIKSGQPVASSTGDILFTEYGVSGSSVFQVSAYLNGEDSESLKIEFLPDLSQKDVTVMLKKRLDCNFMSPNDVLCCMLNKRVGQAILKTVKTITAETVSYALKNFTLKVTGNLGFNYAQVTKGGVSTEFINPKTFESKLQKGLYVIGEALDVDGDCGGYNVTFAFVSGILSARGIKATCTK